MGYDKSESTSIEYHSPKSIVEKSYVRVNSIERKNNRQNLGHV